MANSNKPTSKGKTIIPPPGSHGMGVQEAGKMIKAYRDSRPNEIRLNEHKEGGTFNRDIFDDILAQPGCCGIRYYFALDGSLSETKKDKEKRLTLVVVGVDADGNDLLNTLTNAKQEDGNAMKVSLIGERSWPSTQHKGAQSPLNSDNVL